MIRTQISLEKGQYLRARKEARARGISFAELVRRAVDSQIPAQDGGAPWRKYIGSIESGDKHASASIDSVVYGEV